MTVSGDGLIHEILNGLFERVDWRESLARLPIGVIPGGSGNAFSRTLIHEQVGQIYRLVNPLMGSNLSMFIGQMLTFVRYCATFFSLVVYSLIGNLLEFSYLCAMPSMYN